MEHFNLLVDIKERKVVQTQCLERWSSMPLLLLSFFSTAHFSSPHLLRFRTSSPSSQMFSAVTVLQPQNLAMESAIILSLLLVLQCILNLSLRSSLPPRKSSLPWRRPELSGDPCLPGHPLFTWSRSGDYHRLNNVTIPLPNITDFTSRIACSSIFSRLDIQKGYY